MGVSRSRDDYRLGKPVIQDIPFLFPLCYSFSPSFSSIGDTGETRTTLRCRRAMFPRERKDASVFESLDVTSRLIDSFICACVKKILSILRVFYDG